jgi:hypothetical protein
MQEISYFKMIEGGILVRGVLASGNMGLKEETQPRCGWG